ncbi:hypothetical protein [Clavibacter michiganensis]|uniref:hypothetical protein n=1 Tax=Clavibacter michiganensis TaxID=28447 RepID=UPI00292D3F0A|nr:hypothetical protein [Clavibacter michiganensis]
MYEIDVTWVLLIPAWLGWRTAHAMQRAWRPVTAWVLYSALSAAIVTSHTLLVELIETFRRLRSPDFIGRLLNNLFTVAGAAAAFGILIGQIGTETALEQSVAAGWYALFVAGLCALVNSITPQVTRFYLHTASVGALLLMYSHIRSDLNSWQIAMFSSLPYAGAIVQDALLLAAAKDARLAEPVASHG